VSKKQLHKKMASAKMFGAFQKFLFLANVDFAVMPENQTNLSPAGEENG
jgi:hypothetical protein